jgi:release factor glutamine methyltransferase
MASVVERLAEGRARLEAAGLSPADAAFDAEVLARHALGWDRAALIARGREPEPPGFAAAFETLLQRRGRREPVAQIVGCREFWGLEFEVTRDVLTPRPETELIIEEALAAARDIAVRRAVDVGTGSGCLAVTIAHEMPAARVVALDISHAALLVARRNALRHRVSDRIHFVQSDLLAGLAVEADLIVCNPPYMAGAERSMLQPEVSEYEPLRALSGGATGLEVMARLLHTASASLAPSGRLVVEFGFGQSEGVAALAARTGWSVVRVRQDLQGIPRTIVLTKGGHG